MNRRSFLRNAASSVGLGLVSATTIAHQDLSSLTNGAITADTSRISALESPFTTEALTQMIEALWPNVETMGAKAFEEYVDMSPRWRGVERPAYRVVPATIRIRAEGEGHEIRYRLLSAVWDIFRAARVSQTYAKFADGTLVWRRKPAIEVEHDFDAGTVWTAIRCRAAVRPHPRYWGDPEIEKASLNLWAERTLA
jgi:hypothetical protein